MALGSFCEACGSQGSTLPVPPVKTPLGSLVVGLDPECEDCHTMARDAGVALPLRFGQPPLEKP